jgi:uncharacterized glyoxalase superfamily protein PhnB
VIPVLAYADLAEAIAWLCAAFGFTLRLQIGDHRAQLNVGDGAIVLTGEREAGAQDAYSVMVRVEDVQSHHDRAVHRGARLVLPPTDYPYGERQYTVQDFAGYHWTFSQSIADVDPREWGGTPGQL